MSNTKSPDSDASSSGIDDPATSPDSDASSSGIDDPATSPDSDAAAVGDDQKPTGEQARRRLAVLAGIGSVVLVLDQLTKIWAASALADRDIDLFWTARLHLIRNTGGAFGLGSRLGQVLAVVVTAVVVAIVLHARNVDDRRMLLLFGAIVGGAIGNLIDRIVRADDGLLSGGVIDFIDFQWWPVFNIADIAVVLGALGLLMLNLREPAPRSPTS